MSIDDYTTELFNMLRKRNESQDARLKSLTVTSQRSEVSGAVQAVAFADLPSASIVGRLLFVTDGRKAGEGAGSGTGVLVYDDGTAWRRTSDDTTVAN